MIHSMDLGVRVLQWRDDDDTWRIVDPRQLEDERAGRFTPSDDEWATVQPGVGINAGQTYVCGQVVDGLPERVTVGGENATVHLLGSLWAATWSVPRQRVVVQLNAHEVVFDLGRRPHYVTPSPGEPVLHDQPALGWVRLRDGDRRAVGERS